MSAKLYDCIIVGGGVAGMSAALNLLRASKSVLILEKENFGGQIATSPRVENIPSIKSISGIEYTDLMFTQITDLGAEFELEDVLNIEKKDEEFIVKTNYSTYSSKSIIIANGLKHRRMNLKHEEELIGKGISYCATCDGAFYKDKNVIVIGDANTALQYALLLATYCKTVKICTLFDKFFADDVLVKRVKEKDNITYEHNLSMEEYLYNDSGLYAIKLKNTKTNEIKEVQTDGVFIAIGQIPDNEKFANLVSLDENGYILTDEYMATSTNMVYAIGDCRHKKYRQVATAISDGSIASIELSSKLS